MKKILLSIMAIAVVVAVGAGVTYAYFSSQKVAGANTFSMGTLILKLNSTDSVSGVFGGSNLYPGAVLPEQFLKVKNAGTLNANHLDLVVTLSGDISVADYVLYSVVDGDNGMRFGTSKSTSQSVNLLNPPGDSNYTIKDGDNGNNITIDANHDGKVTLAELAAAGKIRIYPVGTNAGINAGTEATLWMNAKVNTSMGDSEQGKSVTATFTWTLHQDVSQF